MKNKDKTLGKSNQSSSFIKISSFSEFKARDSSSNAILYYNNNYWIFGGWSNWAHDVWYSVADVWRSSDSRKWISINKNPPYSQYSSFVVYKNKMYAFGSQSFSSSDGINWENISINWAQNKRIVNFKEELIGLIDSRVVKYVDGKGFINILDQVPWGKDRKEPVFLSFNDKLWVIGGSTQLINGEIKYKNDVWSSSDGFKWTLINKNAPWLERQWLNGFEYDGKLFIANGHNWNYWPDQYGNIADLWYSQNGEDWFPLQSDYIWGARHASFVTSDNNGKVILSSGYGHGGVSRIYNDVWVLDFKMFFPKSSGFLNELSTWGENLDGTGRAPNEFNGNNYIFILSNRDAFNFDDLPTNLMHLVVGNGVQTATLFSSTELINPPRNLYVQDFAIINCKIAEKFRFISPKSTCY